MSASIAPAAHEPDQARTGQPVTASAQPQALANLDASTRTELLEEYKAIQGQIQKFYEQRQAVLGLVAVMIGALLSFGSRTNSPSVLVSLYLIVFMGAILTRHCTFQIIRRLTYIHAFIEPRCSGMQWCGQLYRLATMQPESKWGKICLTAKRTMPGEFTWSYILLGLVVMLYGLFLDVRDGSDLYQWILIIGLFSVLGASMSIQRAGSVSTYIRLRALWLSSLDLQESKND